MRELINRDNKIQRKKQSTNDREIFQIPDGTWGVRLHGTGDTEEQKYRGGCCCVDRISFHRWQNNSNVTRRHLDKQTRHENETSGS